MERANTTDASYISDNEAQPGLTTSSQSPPSPEGISLAPAIDDSASLSFPTLSPDGSIDSLPTAPYELVDYTPPAALSSLGWRAKMSHTNLSDSTSSLEDAQYDMIDDVSDISNDDHETASLVSTERGDGNMTPEEEVVDIEDDLDNLNSSTTLRGSFETLPGPRQTDNEQTRAENALLDSYMTDDLETPRQSLLGPYGSTSPELNSNVSTQSPLRILFVSERGVTDGEIVQVCQRIATCVTDETTVPRVTRLPPTPQSGESSSSVLIIAGTTQIIVDHCVGASATSYLGPGCYTLSIASDDKEREMIFNTGSFGPVSELAAPSLVIYYLSPGHGYSSWFRHVKQAMLELHTPSITLGAPGFDFADIHGPSKRLANSSEMVLTNEAFFDNDDTVLRVDMKCMLYHQWEVDRKSNAMEAKFRKAWSGVAKGMLGLIMLSQLFSVGFGLYCLYSLFAPGPNSASQIAIRRAALSNALVEVMNTTDATKIFDIEHLVPQNTTSTYDAPFQGKAPNHIVVTIPQKTNGRGFSTPTKWAVQKSEVREVPFNLTKLIDGVYHVSIDPKDAYNQVCVISQTKNPNTSGKACHTFGSRLWQRETYEKASMELSKAVNKDVAVASQRVKTLKDKLGVELVAGAAATKNVTTELAKYVARDLQVFAHTAVSMFDKMDEARVEAMQRLDDRINRDVHTGLIKLGYGVQKLQSGVQKSLQVTSHYTKDLIPTKQTFSKSLSGARTRALSFKDRLSGLRKDTNSTSATKELSLRLQNFFKPDEKSKRAGSLSDIAKCMRAEDYKLCRREQRMKAKAVDAYKPPSAVAKLSAREVLAEAVKEKERELKAKGGCGRKGSGKQREVRKKMKATRKEGKKLQ